jgi:hypothetical protein
MAKKYRPYFTLPELHEIITALKSQPTPNRMTLIKYLEKYCLEITHSVREESYTANPRKTLSQRLELDDPSDIPTISIIPQPIQITGEAAYQKQLINPLHCTPKEIEAAMEYRYLNDLMSPDEEKQYEHSLLSQSSTK